MTDRAELESALLARYPEPWVRLHLVAFPEAYFAAFDAEQIADHLGRITALGDDRPVAVAIEPEGAGEWTLEVVGLDAFQFLSTLCMLLAAHGLAIVEGRIFTSRPGPAIEEPAGGRARHVPAARARPDRRPKVVDWLRVRSDGPADWAGFEAELTALAKLLRAGRHEDVLHRLIGPFVTALRERRAIAAEAAPLDVTIAASDDAPATEVRVQAQDSFGFLSLTTGALALCGFAITQADVRTDDGRVADTFLIVDPFGRPIAPGPRRESLRLALILIAHYSDYLPTATNPESALVHFSRFASDTMARPEWARDYAALDRPEVLHALVRVLGESDFLWEDYLHAQPENLLPMVADPAQWQRARTPAELAADRDAALAGVGETFEARGQALRRFRDREFFRAGVRAILGLSGGPEGLSAELTDVADALLRGACRITDDAFGSDLPRRPDGRPVPWALLALGKCGGRELGFGSDLELLFVYDDRALAEPAGAAFDRVVLLLREVLATSPGGTLEVDFRLRPYGRSGPPATALSALAAYHAPDGPAWGYERQALIKLRAVAGDEALGREVEALRDAIVYGGRPGPFRSPREGEAPAEPVRGGADGGGLAGASPYQTPPIGENETSLGGRPFDLDGCRRLRKLQVGQLVRPGTINAKYSAGALVDLEYFVQGLQITHGACDPSVRTTNTLQAIDALAAAGHLAPGEPERLRSAYRFFRALIDALRVVRGHGKDLVVPPAGSDALRRLAERLHQPDAQALLTALETTLQAVRAFWNDAERRFRRVPE